MMQENNSTLSVIDVATDWIIELGEKSRIKGQIPGLQAGMVKLYLDDVCVVSFAVKFNKKTNVSSYFFNPHVTLTQSLPAEYTARIMHPDGYMYEFPGTSSLGQGNNTLVEKMKKGYLVSAKGGYLYLPVSEREGWRKEIFESYKCAQKALEEIDGISGLFVAYGTLLGQVRTGDFIAHDDDFDCGFIIDVNSPEEAAVRLHSIMAILRQQGCQVKYKNHVGNFYLKFQNLPIIEIWCFYHMVETAELCGYNCVLNSSELELLPLVESQLAGEKVLVPNQADAFLAAIYGESWNIPDPGFQWSPGKRALELMRLFSSESKKLSDA